MFRHALSFVLGGLAVSLSLSRPLDKTPEPPLPAAAVPEAVVPPAAVVQVALGCGGDFQAPEAVKPAAQVTGATPAAPAAAPQFCVPLLGSQSYAASPYAGCTGAQSFFVAGGPQSYGAPGLNFFRVRRLGRRSFAGSFGAGRSGCW